MDWPITLLTTFAVELISAFLFFLSSFSFFFAFLFLYRQSGTICWIDCGACKCSNYFGNIIWALLCDLWTVKSWLRLHKNPSDDDMSGCMGGCCNFYKVINSSRSYKTTTTKKTHLRIVCAYKISGFLCIYFVFVLFIKSIYD